MSGPFLNGSITSMEWLAACLIGRSKAVLLRIKSRVRPATVFAATLVAITGILIAGCPSNCQQTPPATPTQLATPTLMQLAIPGLSPTQNFGAVDAQGNPMPGWFVISPVPPPMVLPTRGCGVRLNISATSNYFKVSLRGLDGTLTPLTQNYTGWAPPEEGYFYIIDENPNPSPPIFLMYVQAPIKNCTNFDILVVDHSVTGNATDSAPMTVNLRQRKVFTVTVHVVGSGHVTSNPPGITCGSSAGGQTLPDCSHDFGGPGLVKLEPHGNDPNTITFKGWSGNCAPNVQECQLTLDGTMAIGATAYFGATSGPPPTPMPCAAAPVLPGLQWIGTPDCHPIDENPGITVQCDANGWFCCSPHTGANAPRCGGDGQRETLADCQDLGIKAMLIQPGGCYEVDSFP